MKYSITNSLGQLMLYDVLDAENLTTIDISLHGKYFPTGVYFCAVQNGNLAETQSFYITR